MADGGVAHVRVLGPLADAGLRVQERTSRQAGRVQESPLRVGWIVAAGPASNVVVHSRRGAAGGERVCEDALGPHRLRRDERQQRGESGERKAGQESDRLSGDSGGLPTGRGTGEAGFRYDAR